MNKNLKIGKIFIYSFFTATIVSHPIHSNCLRTKNPIQSKFTTNLSPPNRSIPPQHAQPSLHGYAACMCVKYYTWNSMRSVMCKEGAREKSGIVSNRHRNNKTQIENIRCYSAVRYRFM